MNLSKLQSEAVLELNERFVMSKFNGNRIMRRDVCKRYTTPATIKNIEQFLSDQIQKAVEETNQSLHKQYPYHWWTFIDCLADYPICLKCGVVQNKNNEGDKCRGWVAVKLRDNLSIQSKGR